MSTDSRRARRRPARWAVIGALEAAPIAALTFGAVGLALGLEHLPWRIATATVLAAVGGAIGGALYGRTRPTA